jgi:hypothetical protein
MRDFESISRGLDNYLPDLAFPVKHPMHGRMVCQECFNQNHPKKGCSTAGCNCPCIDIAQMKTKGKDGNKGRAGKEPA